MSYIAKAEHALRTGQPRLAELYMRRALSESEAGQRWLARFDAKREAQLRMIANVKLVVSAFDLFAEALCGMGRSMQLVAEALSFQPSGHTGQDGYALVGDHEG